jgi:hypothetical protein
MATLDRMRKLQLQEALRQNPVQLGWYRHYKGGSFILYSATVHEATGEVLIHYFSSLTHSRITRDRIVFFESVPTAHEDDTPTLPQPKFLPRFSWWRPATRDELAAAAFGGPEEIRKIFGDVPVQQR